MLPEVCIGIVVLGIAAYAVLGSADFGAGFWDLTAGGAHGSTINEARVLGALFASASVLIPFFFGAALGGIASGRVGVGNATGDPIDSWLNPTSALIGAIAVLTGAYL